MLQVIVGAGEGKNHPLLQEVGDAAGAFAGRLASQGVGLLEVRLVGVQDERFPLAEPVVEEALVAVVPPLGHAAGVPERRVGHGFVAVEVEVLALQDPPVEALVLDLVATEVLGARLGREESARGEREEACAKERHLPDHSTSWRGRP